MFKLRIAKLPMTVINKLQSRWDQPSAECDVRIKTVVAPKRGCCGRKTRMDMNRQKYIFGWVALFAGVVFILNAALLLQNIRPNQEEKAAENAVADIKLDILSQQSHKIQLSVLEDRRTFLLNELEQCQEKLSNLSVASRNATSFHSNRLRLRPPALPIGVVIMTHARPAYLEKTLKGVLDILPSENFVLIVSQDGDHTPTVSKINEWRQKVSQKQDGRNLIHIQHLERPEPPPDVKSSKQGPACFYIAAHYKFALNYVFMTLQLQSAIVIEDDLELAPDFFLYMLRMQPLLLSDPTLYAISAWHENSRPGLVKDPAAVMRSEFFPGLGWMLSRSLWVELRPKWPHVYWDDWMREEAQRKGRDSLRPEISRTKTFGEVGATAEAATYSLYWTKMILNQQKVDWDSYPLELLAKDAFDMAFLQRIKSSLLVSSVESLESYHGKSLLLMYSTEDQFSELALKLGLFTEVNKHPRGAYRGVVEFNKGPNKVLLAPGNIESILLDIEKQLKRSRA